MPASYPQSLKIFQVFHDYSDIIWAHSVNEMHDEILSIESTLGTNPFNGTPYSTFSGAVQDLYLNKAPALHTHTHSKLLGDNQGNDHPQYIQVNGYPGFSHPVGGVAGTKPQNLVTLAQLQSFGYINTTQAEFIAEVMLSGLMSGVDSGNAPLLGSIAATGPAWRVQGGLFSGCTDGNGRITVHFATPYNNCVQAFVCTKIPPVPQPTGPRFPCPNGPYAWIESQITLFGISGTGATVQFSHDYSWQGGMWASFTWMVMGT